VQFITLTKAVPVAMLVIAGTALINSPNPIVSSARAAKTTSVSAADMTYFYKNPSPEGVARLMTYFEGIAEKPGAQPPIIGFLAAAFQRYPSDIDKMIPEGLSPRMLGVVAIALGLAGQAARAQSIYQYGAFLAARTRKGEGIPFLQKAKTFGVVNAGYWLGGSFAVMGEKTEAMENLESYTKSVPSDQMAARILDTVRNDRFNIEEKKASP